MIGQTVFIGERNQSGNTAATAPARIQSIDLSSTSGVVPTVEMFLQHTTSVDGISSMPASCVHTPPDRGRQFSAAAQRLWMLGGPGNDLTMSMEKSAAPEMPMAAFAVWNAGRPVVMKHTLASIVEL